MVAETMLHLIKQYFLNLEPYFQFMALFSQKRLHVYACRLQGLNLKTCSNSFFDIYVQHGSFTLSFRGRLDYFNKEGAKPSSQIALEFLYIQVITICITKLTSVKRPQSSQEFCSEKQSISPNSSEVSRQKAQIIISSIPRFKPRYLRRKGCSLHQIHYSISITTSIISDYQLENRLHNSELFVEL